MTRPIDAIDLVAVVLLVFLPLNFLYGAVLTHVGPPDKNDFTSYYVAAQVVREGTPESLYYPDPVGSLLAQASVQHPWADIARAHGVENPNYYLYPPLFAVAFLPLAFLSYPAAFAIWLGLNVVFLAAALWICLPPAGKRRLPALAASLLVAGTFYPVWHHLKIGQSSLLVLLLLAVTLALLRLRRDGAAGITLAFAVLLKLTPAIFILFLVFRRRWRAVGFTLIGLVALTAISAAATGWEAQVTYYTKIVPLLGAGTAFYPNQSINGFVTRLLGMGDYRKADLSAALPVARLAATAVSAILAGLSLFLVWWRRKEPGVEAEEDGFLLLLIASLLASPISWEHHYVALLLPAWILARRWGGGVGGEMGGCVRRAVPFLAGGALALAGSYVGVAVFEKFGIGPLRPFLSSAACVGGIALWLIFAAGWSRLEPEEGGSRRRVRGQTALLAMMAVFAGSQFLLKLAEYDTSFAYGDFTSYYVAAAAVIDGKPAALYQPETPDPILAKALAPSPWRDVADARGVRDANYYLYPPIFAILISPLGLLPYAAAHDLWYAVSLAALGATLLWYFRREGRKLSGAEIAGALILTALMWPALFTFGAGQANYVILLLVFAALVAAEKGRPAAAGIALAVATAIKLTPGLLVAWFLWKRRYAVVVWSAVGLAAVAVAGILIVGWEVHLTWATRMVPLLSRGCAHWVNQSVSALLSRLTGAQMFAWEIAPPSGFVRAGSAALSAAAIAALAWLTRPGGGSSLRLEYAIVLVTTLFVSPISWIHHAVLSLPAVLFLLRHLVESRRATAGRGILLGVAFLLIGIYFKPFGFFQHPALTPLASYHLAGQLMLWSILAWEIRWIRSAPAPEAAT